MTKILGIDTGTNSHGWAIVENRQMNIICLIKVWTSSRKVF